MRLQVRSLALLIGLRIRHCRELWCSVGHRRGSDLALLWLWRRPVATAPIQPLAWEPPYAMGAALEKAKRQKILSTWFCVPVTHCVREDVKKLLGIYHIYR